MIVLVGFLKRDRINSSFNNQGYTLELGFTFFVSPGNVLNKKAHFYINTKTLGLACANTIKKMEKSKLFELGFIKLTYCRI